RPAKKRVANPRKRLPAHAGGAAVATIGQERKGLPMLVLSRQRGEAIIIGDDMEVTVVDIRGDKVRLGITAPRTTSVHRKEVYDAIRAENRSASGMSPDDVPRTISP